MSEPAIKQRRRRVIRQAIKILENEGYLAYPGDGISCDVVAVSAFGRARLIRICFDSEPVPKNQTPLNVPVEVWVKKKGKKLRG